MKLRLMERTFFDKTLNVLGAAAGLAVGLEVGNGFVEDLVLGTAGAVTGAILTDKVVQSVQK